jgi:hypothetical protein
LVLAVVVPAGAQEPDPSVPGPTAPDVTAPQPPPPDPSAGDPTTGAPEPPEGEAPPEPAPAPLDPSPHVRVLVAHFAIFDAQARLALEQMALADAQAVRALADAECNRRSNAWQQKSRRSNWRASSCATSP